MPKLWLTYAWRDNESLQVDYIIQELTKAGVEVGFDRVKLVPGKRLWPQIERYIRSPEESDAWALIVSKASLESEPCREELAYALDRALAARDKDYPLIGIFVERVDRSIVPSAIQTRLYTDIRDPHWVEKVKAGIERRAPAMAAANVPPLFVDLHPIPNALLVEARPRAGRWMPCLAAVPIADEHTLTMLMVGPVGRPPTAGMVHGGPSVSEDKKLYLWTLMQEATPYTSVYIRLSGPPRELAIGQDGMVYFLSSTTIGQIGAHFRSLHRGGAKK